MGGGYTTEAQLTGEEKIGGIQLEVTPSYRNFSSKSFSIDNLGYGRSRIAVFKTPRELLLEPGIKISMWPIPPSFRRPARVSDFMDNEQLAEQPPTLVLKIQKLVFLFACCIY